MLSKLKAVSTAITGVLASVSGLYRVGGALFGVAGILWVFFGHTTSATYAVVTGTSVFAVLYVLAQAVERMVEWVVEGLSLIPDSPGDTKARAVRKLRQANSTTNGNPDLSAFDDSETRATVEKTVDDKRADIRFLSHGLSILFCAIAVNWTNYGMMDSLGAHGLSNDLNRLITALAAAGGSKGLHELIGRAQVAKERAQTA
jgi:hypothetical protein